MIPEDNIPNSKILFKIEDFNEQLAKSLVSLKRHKSSLSYSWIKNVDKKIEVKNKFKSPVQETRLWEEDDFQPKKKRNLEVSTNFKLFYVKLCFMLNFKEWLFRVNDYKQFNFIHLI